MCVCVCSQFTRKGKKGCADSRLRTKLQRDTCPLEFYSLAVQASLRLFPDFKDTTATGSLDWRDE